MTSSKKQYRKLCKYYKKELEKCHNISFNMLENCMDYFSTYLRFMRDMYILTAEELDPNKNLLIASICMAVGEYERYTTCINDYYNTSSNLIEQIDKTKTKEEVAELYNQERKFHWDTFWGIIKLNMEGWCNNNDLTI